MIFYYFFLFHNLFFCALSRDITFFQIFLGRRSFLLFLLFLNFFVFFFYRTEALEVFVCFSGLKIIIINLINIITATNK